jgi:type IV pilus assembly protein PilV
MSLLETMIAMVIFSVGTMGVASMMLTSMRNNDATLSRTQSTVLATEIYEKMLANLQAAAAGNYDLSMNSGLPTSTSLDCATTSATCSPAQIAEWDMAMWGARAQRILPSADASIGVDTSVDPMVIQVQVQFDALMETAGVTTETFTFRAR